MRQLILGLVIGGVLAFALAGVAFLPMAIETGRMIRAVGNHPPLIGHASLPWESFNASQLEPRALKNVFFNRSETKALGSPYVGPLALLGILMCILAYRPRDSFRSIFNRDLRPYRIVLLDCGIRDALWIGLSAFSHTTPQSHARGCALPCYFYYTYRAAWLVWDFRC